MINHNTSSSAQSISSGFTDLPLTTVYQSSTLKKWVHTLSGYNAVECTEGKAKSFADDVLIRSFQCKFQSQSINHWAETKTKKSS